MTATPPFLPFALPDISEDEIASVVETLRSGWITTGPKTKEFERRFAEATGAPHAVMVNSCTAAMHLALEAIGIKPGDEVIVPTMTFAATAEVVRYLGATPVLVDVRASDHNIDPAAIERAITPRTRAIIPVHFGGVPADMDEIMAIARANELLVVADAAHCFPGSYKGRPVGTLADISCFSFYATKTITTGEGGAAVTANEQWADRMRIMSLARDLAGCVETVHRRGELVLRDCRSGLQVQHDLTWLLRWGSANSNGARNAGPAQGYCLGIRRGL